MTKNQSNQDLQDLADSLKSFDGDATAYRRLFERITKLIPCTQILVISTMPRGGTQILQPQNCPELLLKAYGREFHSADKATWQAIFRNKPMRADQIWEGEEFENSSYRRGVMGPMGLHSLAVAPLAAPVLAGYPGALHLYRSEAEGDFSAVEVKLLSQVAEQLDAALLSSRTARMSKKGEACEPVGGCCRQFIFDHRLHQHSVYADGTPLDSALAKEIRRRAERQFQHLNGELVTTDRVQLPDVTGNLWTFRTTLYKRYPALGNGAFVFFCLQPDPCEWEAVRATDFQGDPELARLVPTLRFMKEEFPQNPTLDEIAAKANLSPFHFHRRFTELFGQTPKHFLLGCQIQKAKAQLLSRDVPLAKIAKGCGFAHQSHFTSRFKQATGLTPTRWRRVAIEQLQAQRQGEPAKADSEQMEQPASESESPKHGRSEKGSKTEKTERVMAKTPGCSV